MTPTLNPDYELVYIDQESDKIFLKNQFFKNMVSLSKIEYEIIQFYIDNPDYEKVFAHYSKQYEMSRDFVYALVSKAEASGVLISEGYLARKGKVQAESSGHVSNVLFYFMVTKLQSLVSLLGVKSKLELRGNFKYYRLLSFGLENTCLERLCLSRSFQLSMIMLYFALFATVLFAFLNIDSYTMAINFSRVASDQAFLIVPVILTGTLLLTFLHELGHFLLYKRFGGVTSEMGMALMTGIIPTLYVTTSSLHLWKHRGNRLLVIMGGILVDVLLLLTCLYFAYTSGSAVVAFYAYFFSVMMMYRTVFNINPFMPRTDGYFAICEILSKPTLHSLSYTNFGSLIAKVKGREWRSVSFSEMGYSTYFMLSMFFMVANYLLLFSPLIIFIYYWIIGGRR